MFRGLHESLSGPSNLSLLAKDLLPSLTRRRKPVESAAFRLPQSGIRAPGPATSGGGGKKKKKGRAAHHPPGDSQRDCVPSANSKMRLCVQRWQRKAGTGRRKRREKKENEATPSCVQQGARTEAQGREDDDCGTLQTAARAIGGAAASRK